MKQYPLFKVHIDIEAAMGEIKKVMESGYINEGVQVTQLETDQILLVRHLEQETTT
jgi:hypothetical protein